MLGWFTSAFAGAGAGAADPDFSPSLQRAWSVLEQASLFQSHSDPVQNDDSIVVFGKLLAPFPLDSDGTRLTSDELIGKCKLVLTSQPKTCVTLEYESRLCPGETQHASIELAIWMQLLNAAEFQLDGEQRGYQTQFYANSLFSYCSAASAPAQTRSRIYYNAILLKPLVSFHPVMLLDRNSHWDSICILDETRAIFTSRSSGRFVTNLSVQSQARRPIVHLAVAGRMDDRSALTNCIVEHETLFSAQFSSGASLLDIVSLDSLQHVARPLDENSAPVLCDLIRPSLGGMIVLLATERELDLLEQCVLQACIDDKRPVLILSPDLVLVARL